MSWDKDLIVVKRMVEEYKGLLALQGILERLAGAEHLVKQLESKAAEVQAMQAKIQALDVQYGERLRALDVAAEAHRADLAAREAPLRQRMADLESAAVTKVRDLEIKATALQEQILRLTQERQAAQGEVAAAQRRLTEVTQAWDTVRQKVGAV